MFSLKLKSIKRVALHKNEISESDRVSSLSARHTVTLRLSVCVPCAILSVFHMVLGVRVTVSVCLCVTVDCVTMSLSLYVCVSGIYLSVPCYMYEATPHYRQLN